MVVEFRYVGAGGEGLVSGAGYDNGANAGILREALDGRWDCFPHIEAERVAPERRVEYEITSGPANFGDEL